MVRTKNPFIGKLIKITECWCKAPSYWSMEPGSIHIVVEPPPNCKNSKNTIWVNGMNEPVSLLKEEFEFITLKRTK